MMFRETLKMNKFIKVLSIAAAMVLCLVITVFADNGQTVFSFNFADNGDKADISLTTDTFTGVGGIDIQINYDTNSLELIESSAKCGIKNGDIAVNKGSIRIIWETTDEVELPEVFASATFKKLNESAEVSNITVVVNEYYDNSTSLIDLPYQISFQNAEKVEKAKSQFPVWIIVLIVCLLALAVAGYYFIVIKGYFRPANAKHLSKPDIVALLTRKNKQEQETEERE